MNNIFLFVVATLIWGSTWLVITFQLGEVDPLVSVVYRFALATLMLFGFCWFKRRNLSFSLKDHIAMAAQGSLLFGFNYWATYESERFITSALAAVISTTIIYFNVFLSRAFLKQPVRKDVLIGATLGFIGVLLIFAPELKQQNPKLVWMGIALATTASFLASSGNVLAAYNQSRKIPVVQANAWGMAHATVIMGLIALLSGSEFNFEYTLSYSISLIYLALFGSVLAFGAYLTLLGNIGPDKAAYVVLVYPVVALLLSTMFEDYTWSISALMGLLLILLGNLVAMGRLNRLVRVNKVKVQ